MSRKFPLKCSWSNSASGRRRSHISFPDLIEPSTNVPYGFWMNVYPSEGHWCGFARGGRNLMPKNIYGRRKDEEIQVVGASSDEEACFLIEEELRIWHQDRLNEKASTES